jgi:hypothetical protein
MFRAEILGARASVLESVMLFILEFSPQQAEAAAIDKPRGRAYILSTALLPEAFRTCKYYSIVAFADSPNFNQPFQMMYDLEFHQLSRGGTGMVS